MPLTNDTVRGMRSLFQISLMLAIGMIGLHCNSHGPAQTTDPASIQRRVPPPYPKQPSAKPYPITFSFANSGFAKTFHTDSPNYKGTKYFAFPSFNDHSIFYFADFNRDQKIDLVAGNMPGPIDLVKQNHAGVFETPTKRLFWDELISMVGAADWNGDGTPDILASRQSAGDHVMLGIALGNGDGSFSTAWKDIDSQLDRFAYGGLSRCKDVYGCLYLPAALPVDIDQDGNMDLVLGIAGLGPEGENNNEQGFVVVLYGKGDGTFYDDAVPAHTPRVVHTHGATAALAAADMDLDGKMDIVVAHRGADNLPVPGQTIHGASILYGQRDGTFAQMRILGEDQGRYEAILVGDINHDNRPDLWFRAVEGFYLMRNLGNHSFSPLQSWPIPNMPSQDAWWWFLDLALEDMDGDGNKDLIALVQSDKISFDRRFDPPSERSSLFVYAGKGDGDFFAPQEIPVGNGGVKLHIADIDADKKPDVMVAHWLEWWPEGKYYTSGVSTHPNHTKKTNQK